MVTELPQQSTLTTEAAEDRWAQIREERREEEEELKALLDLLNTLPQKKSGEWGHQPCTLTAVASTLSYRCR